MLTPDWDFFINIYLEEGGSMLLTNRAQLVIGKQDIVEKKGLAHIEILYLLRAFSSQPFSCFSMARNTQ